MAIPTMIDGMKNSEIKISRPLLIKATFFELLLMVVTFDTRIFRFRGSLFFSAIESKAASLNYPVAALESGNE